MWASESQFRGRPKTETSRAAPAHSAPATRSETVAGSAPEKTWLPAILQGFRAVLSMRIYTFMHHAAISDWLTIIMMSHVVTSGWCLIVVWKGKQLEHPAVSKLQLDGRAATGGIYHWANFATQLCLIFSATHVWSCTKCTGCLKLQPVVGVARLRSSTTGDA